MYARGLVTVELAVTLGPAQGVVAWYTDTGNTGSAFLKILKSKF